MAVITLKPKDVIMPLNVFLQLQKKIEEERALEAIPIEPLPRKEKKHDGSDTR